MKPFRFSESRPDQIDLVLRRRNAFRCSLLKRVQHVDDACEFGGIDGPKGIPIVAIDDLHDPGSAEPFQWLGGRIRLAALGRIQRMPHVRPDTSGKCFEVLPR